MPHPWWMFWQIGDFLVMATLVTLFVLFVLRANRANAEPQDLDAAHPDPTSTRDAEDGGPATHEPPRLDRPERGD